MTHLLDTSAVLAHFMDEAGAAEVETLLARGPEQVALAAPTWVELDRRLTALIPDAEEKRRVFQLYTTVLCGLIPLDEAAVRAAIQIQNAASDRLPMIDALIAGCAAGAGLILVHRDAHLARVPARELRAVQLPDKV